MSDQAALERRYRRLLAWYPPQHRQRHADEMTGVLLAGSRPGQRSPRLADAASLLWGGLQVRARASLHDRSDPGWRDALAITSVALPLTMLGLQLPFAAAFTIQNGPHAYTLISAAGILLIPLLLTALVLLRLRRSAAVAAAGLTAAMAMLGGPGGFASVYSAHFLFLGLAETIALLASAGPRRGLSLLSWRQRGLAVAAAAAAGLIGVPPVTQLQASLAVAAALLILAAVLAVLFPAARRVLALLAVPGYPYALARSDALTGPAGSGAAYLALLFLPPLLGLVLLARQAWRSRPGATAD